MHTWISDLAIFAKVGFWVSKSMSDRVMGWKRTSAHSVRILIKVWRIQWDYLKDVKVEAVTCMAVHTRVNFGKIAILVKIYIL